MRKNKEEKKKVVISLEDEDEEDGEESDRGRRPLMDDCLLPSGTSPPPSVAWRGVCTKRGALGRGLTRGVAFRRRRRRFRSKREEG
jgi:hypothetical protein